MNRIQIKKMPVHLILPLIIFVLLAVSSYCKAQAPFITVWETDNTGASANNQVQLPATGDFTYTWHDVTDNNTTQSGNGSGNTTITFPKPGQYQIEIIPISTNPFKRFEIYQLSSDDKLKLLEVKQWGDIQWERFIFNGCANLKITATDIPNLNQVTDLSFTFSKSGVENIPNINNWDVSHVTDMSSLFQGLSKFNQSLSNWDVSQVTDMSFMFDGASTFNQPLNSWNVSQLKNNDYMFRGTTSFDQSLEDWDLKNYVGGVGIFYNSAFGCVNYSRTLHGWAKNPNTASNVIFNIWNTNGYSPNVVADRDYLIQTLKWDIQTDALGNCSVALGVKLQDFKANIQQDAIRLSWKTASEQNNKGYNIERSPDGYSWTTIGFIASKSPSGNSTVNLSYHFYDGQPIAGTNYYRLLQTDKNGVSAYSDVINLKFQSQSAIRIYPNPVKDILYINGLTEKESVEIFDATGRSLPVAVSTTAQPIRTINVTGFAAGIYFIVITHKDGQTIKKQFIKT